MTEEPDDRGDGRDDADGDGDRSARDPGDRGDRDGEAVAFDVVADYRCTVCGREAVTSFGAIPSRNPVVQQFHSQRGVSLADRRIWEVDQYVAGGHIEVTSCDPWLVRVSFYEDGDACHVEIDDTLQVVRTEIVSGEDRGR